MSASTGSSPTPTGGTGDDSDLVPPHSFQKFPFPQALQELVDALQYKPGWVFRLNDMDRGQGSRGLTLVVTSRTYNSYHPEKGETYRVNHYMPVPPAAFDKRSWQRWLLDQIILIESHEACEFFRFEYDTPNRVGTEVLGVNHHDERPYAPSHGPGNDPYMIREVGTEQDQRTSFRGEVKEGN